MSCTLITEISFGKHDLENIITAVCFRALWASNFNRKFLLFISLPTHLGNEPSALGPSYRYISDHFHWFRQMPSPHYHHESTQSGAMFITTHRSWTLKQNDVNSWKSTYVYRVEHPGSCTPHVGTVPVTGDCGLCRTSPLHQCSPGTGDWFPFFFFFF